MRVLFKDILEKAPKNSCTAAVISFREGEDN